MGGRFRYLAKICGASFFVAVETVCLVDSGHAAVVCILDKSNSQYGKCPKKGQKCKAIPTSDFLGICCLRSQYADFDLNTGQWTCACPTGQALIGGVCRPAPRPVQCDTTKGFVTSPHGGCMCVPGSIRVGDHCEVPTRPVPPGTKCRAEGGVWATSSDLAQKGGAPKNFCAPRCVRDPRKYFCHSTKFPEHGDCCWPGQTCKLEQVNANAIYCWPPDFVP